MSCWHGPYLSSQASCLITLTHSTTDPGWNSGVGKSCLLISFTEPGAFDDQFQPTIGLYSCTLHATGILHCCDSFHFRTKQFRCLAFRGNILHVNHSLDFKSRHLTLSLNITLTIWLNIKIDTEPAEHCNRLQDQHLTLTLIPSLTLSITNAIHQD